MTGGVKILCPNCEDGNHVKFYYHGAFKCCYCSLTFYLEDAVLEGEPYDALVTVKRKADDLLDGIQKKRKLSDDN